MLIAMPLPIGTTETVQCPRCGTKARVTMSDHGLLFADEDSQSRCPVVTDRSLEHGVLPFDEFALCEPLIAEVERR
jgi:hypothetical protein